MSSTLITPNNMGPVAFGSLLMERDGKQKCHFHARNIHLKRTRVFPHFALPDTQYSFHNPRININEVSPLFYSGQGGRKEDRRRKERTNENERSEATATCLRGAGSKVET